VRYRGERTGDTFTARDPRDPQGDWHTPTYDCEAGGATLLILSFGSTITGRVSGERLEGSLEVTYGGYKRRDQFLDWVDAFHVTLAIQAHRQ
jgi:hypothetical protein